MHDQSLKTHKKRRQLDAFEKYVLRYLAELIFLSQRSAFIVSSPIS